MTYPWKFFTTNGPVPLRVYGKHAQLITPKFLYRTMSLSNTQSEKAATHTICVAFATVVQTRLQIEALPEPHVTGSFCTQM